MSVVISSFREGDEIIKMLPDIIPFSVARRQPKGYFHDELQFLAAVDKNGDPLRLKGSSPDMYREQWLEMIRDNDFVVNEWLKSLDKHIDIVLCCWCPHSRSTRNQMRIYNTFVCHTLLIGRLINKYRPDIDLMLDHDHAVHGLPEWRPENYRIIQ